MATEFVVGPRDRLLHSTRDDAKDFDRARYGDEGKNLRRFVSNEHLPEVPLPVWDHAGLTNLLLKHTDNIS